MLVSELQQDVSVFISQRMDKGPIADLMAEFQTAIDIGNEGMNFAWSVLSDIDLLADDRLNVETSALWANVADSVGAHLISVFRRAGLDL